MISRQFTRYLIVGALGTATHLAILALCVEWLKQDAVVSAAAGFVGALSVSYILNHQWAFESKQSHGSSLWRYIVVSLCGLVLNTAMMMALINYFRFWYLSAQLSVVIIVPIINFVLNRYWTFGAYIKEE
jgi:putative flippase GtrA